MTDSETNMVLAILRTLGYARKEFYFFEDRKWRFDFCFPNEKLAIEVEGGAFKKRTYKSKRTGKIITTIGGRHNSAKGFLNDMEKYNTAAMLGYRLLRFTPQSIMTSKALDIIKECLKKDNGVIG